MGQGIKKSQTLAFVLGAVLTLAISLLPNCVWADDQNPAAPPAVIENSPNSPTATVPNPHRKLYKGEVETNNYASGTEAPLPPKYAGQVYTSETFPAMPEDKIPEPPGGNPLHQGFYIAAMAGFDSYQMLTKVNVTNLGTSVISENPELNAQGLTYTLEGGMGWVFDDPLYLGTELFYNYSNANTSQNINVTSGGITGTYSIQTKILGSYGISLTPGIKLGNSTLMYLKSGFCRIQTKTYETLAALGINTSRSTGVNGLHFGMGFEVAAYKNLSIRAEYMHISGKSFTTALGTKITPSDNQFLLGLNMHFV